MQRASRAVASSVRPYSSNALRRSLSCPSRKRLNPALQQRAGKSTTLNAISGMLKTEDGEVARSEIIPCMVNR